jgi:hypothetical protein
MKQIVRPVFIIGTPRSGTTQLLETLSKSESLWSLYTESTIWNWIAGPKLKNWDSVELDEKDVNPQRKKQIRELFYLSVKNHETIGDIAKPDQLRMIEKTPDNCFRIDFIKSIFPDAYFIYIIRDGRNAVSSMMEAWRLYQKYTVPVSEIRIDLENGEYTNQWWGPLPKNWKNYTHAKLSEVCAFQWIEGNRKARESLKSVLSSRKMVIRFEDFTQHPEQVISRLCIFLNIPYSPLIQNATKRIYPIELDKWKRANQQPIERVKEKLLPTMREMGYSWNN